MVRTVGGRTDRDLQRDVLEELVWEPGVEPHDIGVSVQDGVVTLTGQVESLAVKWAAVQSAHRVAGVRAVADTVEVRLCGDAAPPDEEIALAAARAWEWNSFVPAEQLDVTVANGWVMLRGEVEFGYQRRAAERELRRLRGVRGLTNLIRVRPTAPPTAAEIRRRIQRVLLRRAGMRGLVLDVVGDTVLLDGVVPARSQRAEAERVAWSTPGVCEVRNRVAVRG